MFEQNLLDNCFKDLIKHEDFILHHSCGLVHSLESLCFPKLEMWLYFPSPSELVKSESSLYISAIMVFNVVNYFLILIWEFRSFIILSALLVLMDLLDLLDLYYPFFLQCDYWWTLCKHLNNWIFFKYCLSYGGSSLLLSPHCWSNAVTSEVVCWLTLELVYLSRSTRVMCILLGQRSSLVAKLFCRYNFNLLFWFLLYWRGIYNR